MRKIQKHATMLKALTKSTPSMTKAMIKNGDRDFIDTICECGYNVLKGNVRLTKPQLARLRRHKHTLRKLTKRQSLNKKKTLLLQSGSGLLSALLGPVIGILGSVLGQ